MWAVCVCVCVCVSGCSVCPSESGSVYCFARGLVFASHSTRYAPTHTHTHTHTNEQLGGWAVWITYASCVCARPMKYVVCHLCKHVCQYVCVCMHMFPMCVRVCVCVCVCVCTGPCGCLTFFPSWRLSQYSLLTTLRLALTQTQVSVIVFVAR